MKNYTFDVRLTGYEQITVKAKNVEDARELVLNKFEEHYTPTGAWDLRSKSIEIEPLCDNARNES